MKIKSRFKDYYDYVAHAYGGGDERITYVRERIPDDLTTVTFVRDEIKYGVDFPEPSINSLKCNVSWLVVNGKVYTLIAERNEDYTYKEPKFVTEDNFDNCAHLFRYLSFNHIKWERYQGKDSEWATAISRKIKQPVFIVNEYQRSFNSGSTTFYIDNNIPILQNLHFATFYTPEQLYQEIAYYVSNKMVDSPDLVVNNNMTDKEKIVQHGFDYKQSFRHRK